MRGGVMRGEILGVERRRYWGDDEKLAIVSSVGVGGATVTQIAQRHEVTRQQIYAWRHELKRSLHSGVEIRRSYPALSLERNLRAHGRGYSRQHSGRLVRTCDESAGPADREDRGGYHGQ